MRKSVSSQIYRNGRTRWKSTMPQRQIQKNGSMEIETGASRIFDMRTSGQREEPLQLKRRESKKGDQ